MQSTNSEYGSPYLATHHFSFTKLIYAWLYKSFLRFNPFVIFNIFISKCNLITHFFSVTDYNYFYFVIKLRNLVTCNKLLPNTVYIIVI